jgi:hypothetical protein
MEPLPEDRPPKPPRLGRWQQVSPTQPTKTLPLASVQPSLIISAEPQPCRRQVGSRLAAGHPEGLA